jgi:energy-converting hydrogenase Eha subunit C
MSSVTSCVGGGVFICFTCLHVPYSTVTLITLQRVTMIAAVACCLFLHDAASWFAQECGMAAAKAVANRSAA